MESKKPITAVVIPVEIEKLRRQVELWRRTRRQREPMPGPLWESAACVARRHGVSRVARVVRLDYHTLKERFDSLDSQQSVKPGNMPAFIEMQLPFSACASECLVELEHPRGDRMRIHVKGTPAPDLAALIRSFRGTES